MVKTKSPRGNGNFFLLFCFRLLSLHVSELDDQIIYAHTKAFNLLVQQKKFREKSNKNIFAQFHFFD